MTAMNVYEKLGCFHLDSYLNIVVNEYLSSDNHEKEKQTKEKIKNNLIEKYKLPIINSVLITINPSAIERSIKSQTQ